jgi:cysteine desulfurase
METNLTEVYLDNSATTRCSERAKDLMVKVLMEDYGNPSSLHMKGVEAENYIKEAKKKIAKTLKVDEKEILFTSGGTESNNTALIGAALANKRAGNHIITTSIEHASVSAVAGYLEELGFRVTYLKVDENGIVSLDELREAVCEDTILVSMMMVNNEIGAVEPIEEAVKAIKAKNPNTLVHVDAIQAYGKYRIFPKKLGIDMLSVSGHKIHAPKGTGFLYIKDKTKVKPLIYGGGQQKGMRSGTENVPGVAALGEAAEEIYENFEEKIEHLYQIKKRFVDGVLKIEGATVNGKTGRDSAPQIVSVSIDGVRSEVMLHTLEDRKIYVSAGSACSSNKPSVSHTLTSIGLKSNLLDSTIRFSFSVHTTEEEIDYALEVMNEVVPKLRRYTRK